MGLSNPTLSRRFKLMGLGVCGMAHMFIVVQEVFHVECTSKCACCQSRQCGIAQSSPRRKRNAYPSPPRGQHKWGDAYHCPASPAPQRGSTNGGMLIPAQQAQPHKGVAQMGRCLSLPCKPSPTGSANGGMLIPAQQAQPHKGAAQMGGCLSLTSKGAHGPSSA